MDTGRRPPIDPDPGPAWETLFWDVFERTANPIAMLDESRRLLALNTAGVRLLGYRPGELVGRQIDELIASPPRPQREREWRHLVRTGEQSGSHIYRRHDGSQIQIDFAIRLVLVGERRLLVSVVLPLGRLTLARRVGDGTAPLTPREREVVALIALGRETKGIAEELFISAQTVRTHVQHAMAKLGVHTRAELVAVAFSRGELLPADRHGELVGR